VRPAQEPRDAGTSVVEVMVAAVLLIVVVSMVTSLGILGLKISTGLEVRLDNSVQGDLGMAASSKVLRTAVLPDQLEEQVCEGCAETAIVQATSTRVTFYANLDNTGQGPSLITLEVLQDPDVPGTAILRQSTLPPRPLGDGRYTFCNPATDATCVVNVRPIARGLVWPSTAVFTYFDFDGLPITGTVVAADALPRISSIDVSLTARTRAGDYPTATTIQRVRLPNADINVLVEPS
jgi:hypothetical protein